MCKILRKKIVTANDISGHMDYISHKAMMQEGAYPKGQVKKWGEQSKSFRKKEYIYLGDLKDIREFYKCYRNDILGCFENHNNVWKFFVEQNKDLKYPPMVDLDYWKNWLFDYCFGDVKE